MTMNAVYFNIRVDCESTQQSLQNPALGERALRGLQDVMARTGMKATFVIIPGDIKAHAAMYRELESEGHELGVHLHPAERGYGEFMGVYGPDEQLAMVRQICEQQQCKLVLATTVDMASAYRQKVPWPQGGVKLTLDTQGRGFSGLASS